MADMHVTAPNRRSLRLTPDHCVSSLPVAEALLWLSDRLGWPAW